jgi:glycosyltransferase involved in cell wall biosynthesis
MKTSWNTLPEAVGREIAVLIPAWQPGDLLISLVTSLNAAGVSTIIVVDDGSGPDYRQIFDALLPIPSVHLLRHAINLGKGRALKYGLNFVATELHDIQGVVTADADGQHTVEDILHVAQVLHESHRFVLGARSFRGAVPLRSRFGNSVTRYVFRLFFGCCIGDTQSGLRGVPRKLIPELLSLDGERYEYEMNVLARLCRRGLPPVQIPIETVYLEQNRSSHFDPLRDSMRIYFVLLRFYTSSLIAAAIDLVVFGIAFAVTQNLPFSFIVGRLSSLANFLLNRGFVFRSNASFPESLWRYYALVFAIGLLSYESIKLLTGDLHWNMYAAKLLVETLLSLVSFSVQRTFVFHPRQEV